MKYPLAIAAIVATMASPTAVPADSLYCGNGWYADQIQVPSGGSLLEVRVYGRDIGSAVNVRAQPGRQHDVINTVSVGDRILVSERIYVEFYDEVVGQGCDLWYQVHHFGTQESLGWVYGEFITSDEQWIPQE